MQSKAPNVSAYIEECPPGRQEALKTLRTLCRRILTGFEEGMTYGMPGYSRRGEVEVAFASQKNYISLYILRQDALASQRPQLKGARVGKGCIRYGTPARIDFAVVEEMLVATRESTGHICGD